MLKSYLKTALRHLRRRKGYAFINIFGLAAGMAACLLIGPYVRHELSYDVFHEKGERIYRVDELSAQLPGSKDVPNPYVQTKLLPGSKQRSRRSKRPYASVRCAVASGTAASSSTT